MDSIIQCEVLASRSKGSYLWIVLPIGRGESKDDVAFSRSCWPHVGCTQHLRAMDMNVLFSFSIYVYTYMYGFHISFSKHNEQLTELNWYWTDTVGFVICMSRSHFGFKCLGILCAMKRPASTGAERLPHCKNKCGRRVQTKRSKLCSNCFGKNAVSSGARLFVVFLNQST